MRFRLERAMKLAVVGAGLSGAAACRLLLARGKRVILFDDADRGAEAAIRELADRGVETNWGRPNSPAEALRGADALIVSPGVPSDHPLRLAAAEAGIPALGEIELGWVCRGGARIVAVTGTNGKTTVTMLIQHIAREAGLRSIQAGNIGEPFCDAVLEAGDDIERATFVLEVSSFQLDDTLAFAPDVAVLLNVSPDHLDRHGTMEAYTEAKRRITRFQNPDQVLIVNQDDAECLMTGRRTRARVERFSIARPVERGAYLDEERLVLVRPGAKPQRVTDVDRLKLVGMHNIGNCLAAASAASAMGVGRKVIGKAIESFRAPEHRLEFAGSIGGVDYVNDSKATNIDAMAKAIASFNAPVHLIAGGRDKDSPFEAVRRAVAERVARAYLIGEAATSIAKAWSGAIETEQAGTLEAALQSARARARPGEIVLLAPGCASFDQFSSYADRGRAFQAWVESQPEKEDSRDA